MTNRSIPVILVEALNQILFAIAIYSNRGHSFDCNDWIEFD